MWDAGTMLLAVMVKNLLGTSIPKSVVSWPHNVIAMITLVLTVNNYKRKQHVIMVK